MRWATRLSLVGCVTPGYRRGFRRLVAGLSVMCCIAWLNAVAQAQQKARIIVLVLPEADSVSDVFSGYESLLGQLKELSVGVVVERPRPELSFGERLRRAERLAVHHGALGVVWFDTRSTPGVKVYVYESNKQAHLERELIQSPGSAAAAEELAVVVRSALEAMIAGETLFMDRVSEPAFQAPLASEPVTIIPEKPPRHLWTAAVGYSGASIASRNVSPDWQSGVGFGVWVMPLRWLYFGLHYDFMQPHTLATSGALATINRHPAEVFTGLRWQAPSLALGAEVGLQVDRISRFTQVTDARFRATSPSARWGLAISSKVRLSVALADHIDTFLTGGMDVALVRFDYVVSFPSGQVQLTQKFIRPRAGGGFLVHF